MEEKLQLPVSSYRGEECIKCFNFSGDYLRDWLLSWSPGGTWHILDNWEPLKTKKVISTSMLILAIALSSILEQSWQAKHSSSHILSGKGKKLDHTSNVLISSGAKGGIGAGETWHILNTWKSLIKTMV